MGHVINIFQLYSILFRKKLPKDGYAIVGLSWHDLYPCETLNFVLGQVS